MKTHLFKNNHVARSRRAFTLVEIMTVLGVTVFLSTLVAPAVTSMIMGGRFTQAVTQVSSAFEKAHEYAIAKGTYTYVGFTSPDSSGQIFVGIFASKDGTSGGVSLSTSGTYQVAQAGSSGSDSIVLLDQLTNLQGTLLEDSIPARNTLNSNSSLISGASPTAKGVGFNYNSNAYGNVVEFTPAGEVKVTQSIPTAVQLVLVPANGNPTNPVTNDSAASAIQIAGITGQVTVYNPGGT